MTESARVIKDKPLVLHIFPSFEVGGAQRRTATYLNKSQAPFQHQIYALDGCYKAMSLVRNFKQADLPDHFISKGSMLRAVCGARAALKRIKPDLLVCYNWGSIEWTIAARGCIPTLHIQDGFAADEQTHEKNRRKWMRRFAYKGCAGVVVPSHTLEAIARQSWRIKPHKLHYVPNGIHLAQFEGAADPGLLASHGLTGEETLIGTVARLKPEKNIGRLIEAFSYVQDQFPATRLVIVGDGPGMPALTMLAERIGLKNRVIFTGNLDQPEKIIPAFDIFALSSNTEQMPLSVLEAMAASKPVVSTDVGDVRQMVSPTNESYVSGMDATSLTEHLCQLLADPSLMAYVGRENRTHVERHYSEAVMIDHYDQLLKSVIDTTLKR